jgi:hypothetical protein
MAGTYEKIATETLSSTSSTITFSTISQNYTDLVIIGHTQFGSASGVKLRFNSDTGANYAWINFIAQATSTTAGRGTSTTSLYNNFVWGDATASNNYTPYIINIMSYSNTTTHKSVLWQYGSGANIQGTNSEVGFIKGQWRNTNAITSIEFSPFNATTFSNGTSFTLYGIKAA